MVCDEDSSMRGDDEHTMEKYSRDGLLVYFGVPGCNPVGIVARGNHVFERYCVVVDRV